MPVIDLSPDELKKEINRRLIYLFVFVILVFAILLGRALFLQIVKVDYYRRLSENNRLRVVPLHPYRGLILDRRGEVIVNNVPAYHLSIVLEDVPDIEKTIGRISELISISTEEIRKALSSKNRAPFEPARVKEDISLKEVAIVESHRMELPGVFIEVEGRRGYLHGELAAHLLGYVREVTPEQQEREGLPLGSVIGQEGVEKAYDSILRGRPGKKEIEVNALGHETRVLSIKEPAPGNNLYLTIDLRLQRTAEEILNGKKGAIVAINPQNGHILAMVSKPAYDPRLFSGKISPENWIAFINHPDRPLNNKTIQGLYPPASVFKIILASASLEKKILLPKTYCAGYLYFGRRVYNDWKRGGHGSVDLHRAIVESCDVYFYNLGNELGIDTLAEFAKKFGLGMATGIDLPSEKGGIIPSTEWKQQAKNEIWFPGETLSASIGQGYISITPIQLTLMMGAVGNSGIRYRPMVFLGFEDRTEKKPYLFPPVQMGKIQATEETLKIIREALIGVVEDTHGTGGAARSSLARIGGKTGTAQVIARREGVSAEDLPEEFRDHAWFVAFAPAENPKIAIAVLVEHGGHGGSAAAPLAKMVIEEYLRNEAL